MRNLKLITFVSIPLSPIAELFERYVFGDWEFVKFLTILICLDTVLGFLKHYLAHDVDSRAFAMIVKKLIANRYRGIENPFGHIWKYTDGANIQVTTNFSDTSYTGYDKKGNICRTNGYAKKMLLGAREDESVVVL